MAHLLTPENFQKGFLIDDEQMAGVSEDEGRFVAFVMNHATGECAGSWVFSDLNMALSSINAIPRSWAYEASSECGGGSCEDGGCGKGPCQQSCQVTGSCELET
jgi:hypothetical protein